MSKRRANHRPTYNITTITKEEATAPLSTHLPSDLQAAIVPKLGSPPSSKEADTYIVLKLGSPPWQPTLPK